MTLITKYQIITKSKTTKYNITITWHSVDV